MEGPQRHRLRRPVVERAAGALERRDHAAGLDGDAMLVAARAGLGISTLSCFVASAYPDLVRVAPQKLASVADLWLLAHPDLVELPAVRAVIDFVTASAREDRVRLRG